MSDETGVGNGPGPLRHPRPLTPAELHWQLEREQEAVVNRLTRELSLLRAQQSASVVSATSSTASVPASAHDPAGVGVDVADGHGSVIHHSIAPIVARQRRSSSSVSNRNRQVVLPPIHTTAPSQAAIERARETVISRQGSVASRRSRASSPTQNLESLPPHYHHRQSLSSHHPAPLPLTAAAAAAAASVSSPSPTTSTFGPATSRYEEIAMHRAELEVARRENEVLKRRIRELERALRSSIDGGNGGKGSSTAVAGAGRGRHGTDTGTATASREKSKTKQGRDGSSSGQDAEEKEHRVDAGDDNNKSDDPPPPSPHHQDEGVKLVN